ncbi:trypsin-1-like isoform X1 [Choristoneura fumiferana]|uniref:trypsin-1-like isoform X1 n=1 Tax=Choristoneura fumiferana TaxID=7141 RepID=UPI003D15BC3F
MAKAVLALVIISVSNSLGKSNSHIETLVVQGDYADIKDFGYAAYLAIQCDSKEENTTNGFSCGSSILNHKFLLTAAHCLNDCKSSSFISVNVGSAHKRKGIKKTSSKFVTHKKYGFPNMASDIALVKLKGTLEFGSNVYRIVLMKNPPYEQVAVVSGWGLTDEIDVKREKLLKFTKQRLWSRSDCRELIKDLPKGSFCAGEKKANSYASFGDSGGALVVRNSTQIGIVSYKIIAVSRSLAVYTNASYFYDWIEKKTKLLNC